jgi:hypothetical protein
MFQSINRKEEVIFIFALNLSLSLLLLCILSIPVGCNASFYLNGCNHYFFNSHKCQYALNPRVYKTVIITHHLRGKFFLMENLNVFCQIPYSYDVRTILDSKLCINFVKSCVQFLCEIRNKAIKREFSHMKSLIQKRKLNIL